MVVLVVVEVVVAASGCGTGGGHLLHTLLLLCASASLEKKQLPWYRYQVPEINHPYHHHQLTSNSSSTNLLLVVVGVAVVVVGAADCGSGGDGHLYVAAVLVKFYLVLVCTWYQLKLCADAHRLTMRATRYIPRLPHNHRVD